MPPERTESRQDRRTRVAEYLDAAKAKIGVQSDYALAKRLEVNPALITNLRRGRREMPLIIAVKLAITLDADPMLIISKMKVLSERNPKHLEFWRSFMRRAVMAAVTACTQGFGCFGSYGIGRKQAGGMTAFECGSKFA